MLYDAGAYDKNRRVLNYFTRWNDKVELEVIKLMLEHGSPPTSLKFDKVKPLLQEVK